MLVVVDLITKNYKSSNEIIKQMKLVYCIVLLVCSIYTVVGWEPSVIESVCTSPEACSQKDAIGRSTWRLLHAIADLNEDDDDCRKHLAHLLDALAAVYPCVECRRHIRQFISHSVSQKPMKTPQCTNEWMCDFHNVVNMRLQKPIYNCTLLK